MPGWIYRVTTARLSGGEPMQDLYHAVFDNENQARREVREASGGAEDADVETVRELTPDEIAGLRLRRNQVERAP